MFPWSGEPSEVSAVNDWVKSSEWVWDSPYVRLQRAVRAQRIKANRRRRTHSNYPPTHRHGEGTPSTTWDRWSSGLSDEGDPGFLVSWGPVAIPGGLGGLWSRGEIIYLTLAMGLNIQNKQFCFTVLHSPFNFYITSQYKSFTTTLQS